MSAMGQTAREVELAMIREVRKSLDSINWPLVPGVNHAGADKDRINEWLAQHLVRTSGLVHLEFQRKVEAATREAAP